MASFDTGVVTRSSGVEERRFRLSPQEVGLVWEVTVWVLSEQTDPNVPMTITVALEDSADNRANWRHITTFKNSGGGSRSTLRINPAGGVQRDVRMVAIVEGDIQIRFQGQSL